LQAHVNNHTYLISLGPRSAMSNPRPSRRFCAAQFRFRCSKVLYELTTCPYFDNPEFNSFVAGGPQCHIITSDTIAVRFRMLSGHSKLNLTKA